MKKYKEKLRGQKYDLVDTGKNITLKSDRHYIVRQY